jgi:uncharacterized protein (DUF1499 family)
MTLPPLAILFGKGPAGLPPPAPIDFPRLTLPETPNAFLAAPESHAGPKHRALAPIALPPERVWRDLRGLAADFPRAWRRAEWPELRQAEWVVRTRLLNFPDLLTAQVDALPDGRSALWLYSRSLFGHSDFGTNRRRAEQWLAALDAALLA